MDISIKEVRFQREQSILISFDLTIQYGVETRTFEISHIMKPIHLFETEDDSIFHVGRDWIKGAIIFNVDARAITRI